MRGTGKENWCRELVIYPHTIDTAGMGISLKFCAGKKQIYVSLNVFTCELAALSRIYAAIRSLLSTNLPSYNRL